MRKGRMRRVTSDSHALGSPAGGRWVGRSGPCDMCMNTYSMISIMNTLPWLPARAAAMYQYTLQETVASIVSTAQ